MKTQRHTAQMEAIREAVGAYRPKIQNSWQKKRPQFCTTLHCSERWSYLHRVLQQIHVPQQTKVVDVFTLLNFTDLERATNNLYKRIYFQFSRKEIYYYY